MKNQIRIDFDKNYDVLYLGFSDRKNSYGIEDDNGIITLRDMNNGMMTGVTILNFCKKLRDNSIYSLLKDFPVDIKHDILPAISI